MQRLLLLFSTVLALYACSYPTPIKPVVEQPANVGSAKPLVPAEVIQPSLAIAGGKEAPAPIAPEAEKPATVETVETKPAPIALPTEKPFPHIALLLPLQSAIFGAAAETVQQGFFAAANYKRQMLPVRVYSNFDENSSVATVYHQAIANGARAVVGPLTRNGVIALTADPDIPVPTLALNTVEGQFAPQLYFFGMAVEAEARQVAQLAMQQGLHQAIIITTHTQLSQRLQSAFEEEWTGSANSKGRGILREIEYNDDPAAFADITNITDTMVFLAADAGKARLIRPYLPNKLPVYATSQIFTGNDNVLTNYDLNGIRFVDMPWLLAPDHPAVMIYPRTNPPLSADSERLYALGIDAFRIIQLMLNNKIASAMPLDGVSGQILLTGHYFQHLGIPAVFSQGGAQPTDALASHATQSLQGGSNNAP